jgi:hypothetical protein
LTTLLEPALKVAPEPDDDVPDPLLLPLLLQAAIPSAAARVTAAVAMILRLFIG